MTFFDLCALLAVCFSLAPAAHLGPGLPFEQAARLYYGADPPVSYGYATRFGPDSSAWAELDWTAVEAARQYDDFGAVLAGGNYGYHQDDEGEYLLENLGNFMRLVTHPHVGLNKQQRRLVRLSLLSDPQRRHLYVGVIIVRSPNDLGREYCLLDYQDFEPLGLVIAGGVVARNDWLYYGDSLNDFYEHPRLGVRELLGRRGQTYWWLADLPDSLYQRVARPSGEALVLLAPPSWCSDGLAEQRWISLRQTGTQIP